MTKAMTLRPLISMTSQCKILMDSMGLDCLRKKTESTSGSKCSRHPWKGDGQDSSPEQIHSNRQTHSDFC